MKTTLAIAAAAFGLAAAGQASATIVIGTGPGTVQPDQNVLFTNNPTAGSTIDGITNQSSDLVAILGGETLVGDGGQARVQAQSGTIDTTFTFDGTSGQTLGFDLVDPSRAFASTEFRVFGGTATSLTLTFFDTTGHSFTSTLAIPRNGFFNATTQDGQLIDRFSFAANGTIGDVRQIRVGGVTSIGGVPEPSSWALMILGFGGIGALMRRRALSRLGAAA